MYWISVMKKIILTGISVSVVLLILLGIILTRPYLKAYIHYSKYSTIPQIALDNTSVFPIEDAGFLSVDSTSIINRNNEEIVLQGVNLGGWLLQEYWMCPVVGDPSVDRWTHIETMNTLTERFGPQKAQELLELYADHWITEWDIQNIAAHGCNVIRVPFGYWNFMSDDKGTWLTENPDENPGFQKIDWLLNESQINGIYVILDMHGCPGGQNNYDVDGTPGNYQLFNNSEYQDVMEKLWVAIAERYKDNPVVAGYDLMNEGQDFNGDISADPRNAIYDRMYHAIRNVDPNHIIIMEGIWELNRLPFPEDMGWENIIYETHPYGKSDIEGYCNEIVNYSQLHQIPIYFGEFSDMQMLDACRKYGINYTTWTYKGTIYADGTWYMYYTDELSAVDVCNDPYWLIKMKWGNCIQTQFFQPVEEVLSHIQ